MSLMKSLDIKLGKPLEHFILKDAYEKNKLLSIN